MAFKIAYGAGHNKYTDGKRVAKEFDPKETREWFLNDQVARAFADAAGEYEDVEILRVDDPEGEAEVSLSGRCRDANRFGADFFLAIHHDAAGRVFSGGGITAHIIAKGGKAEAYQKSIYESVIAAGGIQGNRSNPYPVSNFYVLRNTNAPAVLMEYGFMDSRVDAPIILNPAYSRKVAFATMEGIAKVAGLKKKVSHGWKKNSTGWWYEYPDGAYITDAWKWINGYWYRFGPTGYMLTGWQYVNEKWYYMDSSGHMLTGWQLVDGKWYYLYEDGHMASGETTPDGCYVNNSGVWEKPEWKAKTKWWYRHADGSYSKNTFEQISGKWYYFDAEGYMVTGWQYLNEKWYYFYEDGHMAADETTPDGYTVDGSGVWEKP